MNLLSLISSWLVIICQVTTKCATVSKSTTFRELNRAWACADAPAWSAPPPFIAQGVRVYREREMGSGASRYLLANWSVGPFDLFWPMAWGTSRPYTSNTIFPVSSWETGYPPANWISAWTPHPPYPGHGTVSCLTWHLSLGRLWQVLTEYPGRVFAQIRAGQIYFSLCVRTGVEGGHVPDFPGPPWRSAFTRGASRFSGDPYPRVAWAILWGSGEADPRLQGSGEACRLLCCPPGPSAVLLGLNRFVSLIY